MPITAAVDTTPATDLNDNPRQFIIAMSCRGFLYV